MSVDCGTLLNGYNGDSCYTFCVGEVSEEVRNLLRVTKESLYLGIQAALPGKRIGDVGYAVQEHCEKAGFGVVREFVGHGIGREMHEDPQVPNYGRRGNGPLIKNGLCIAIEPMMGTERELSLPFPELSVVTVLGKNKLNLYHGETLYQLKGDKRFNALKYVQICARSKNISRGDPDAKFLGL